MHVQEKELQRWLRDTYNYRPFSASMKFKTLCPMTKHAWTEAVKW